MEENPKSFGSEVDFLKQYTKTIVLESKTGNEKIAFINMDTRRSFPAQFYKNR